MLVVADSSALITLAECEGLDLLMIDDRRAKAVAKINEIKTIGSLGMLLFAKRQGLIAEVAPYVAKIRESEIHLGAQIAADILRLAGEK